MTREQYTAIPKVWITAVKVAAVAFLTYLVLGGIAACFFASGS